MKSIDSEETLKQMQSVDIMSVDINTLVDIKDVNISPDLPQEERIREYVRQIKNPFCYRDGDVVIKVSFSDNNISLEERLEEVVPACSLEETFEADG